MTTGITITSSNDSANASSAPEISAVDSIGSATVRNANQPCAPRPAGASYIEPDIA